VKIALAVLIIALAAGCACAKEAEAIDQVGLGAYLITEKTPDFDPDPGWAISYFHLAPRNWYTSVELGLYDATVFYTPPQPGPARAAAKVDVTTWAATIGRAVRSSDGKSYLGAGIGWLVDKDVDLGYGVRFESSTRIGWEIIAGTTKTPVGAQVRYRDGGMPPNTGVSAALTFSW
jgi:hypothetical protein